MTKRILLIFCVLAAMILPASAAVKSHPRKQAFSGSRKTKSKSQRKSTRHGSKSRRPKTVKR